MQIKKITDNNNQIIWENIELIEKIDKLNKKRLNRKKRHPTSKNITTFN